MNRIRTVSPVSGLPLPPPAQSGATVPAGDIRVLDWAGFRSAASFTFDDGQPTNIDYYDDLNSYGLPLTFFVSTCFSNSHPRFDQAWAQAVRDGHEIGNHTVSHPFSNLTKNEGKNLGDHLTEIDQCTDYIKQKFGQKEVVTFAAPYGDAGWAPYARQRFCMNRGVRSGNIAPLDPIDPFDLPVIMAMGGETAEPFIKAIEAAREQGHWSIFLFHSILPGANWYAGVEMRYLGECLAHAAAQADLWTDTLARVSAYWLGQKAFADSRITEDGGKKTWAWKLPEHFPAGTYLRVASAGRLTQDGKDLKPVIAGIYEISLDSGSLTLSV